MRSLTNQPFADSPSPRNRCRIAGWTDFWESAGLGIKTAALPAAALLSWVFCITQIRVGRAQVPLSAGVRQLPYQVVMVARILSYDGLLA